MGHAEGKARDRRRSLLAQVHLGIKRRGLSDQRYRDWLQQVTGQRSARDLTDAELQLRRRRGPVERRPGRRRARGRRRPRQAERRSMGQARLARARAGLERTDGRASRHRGAARDQGGEPAVLDSAGHHARSHRTAEAPRAEGCQGGLSIGCLGRPTTCPGRKPAALSPPHWQEESYHGQG
jgi:Bacteriophage Mu, GemA protein